MQKLMLALNVDANFLLQDEMREINMDSSLEKSGKVSQPAYEVAQAYDQQEDIDRRNSARFALGLDKEKAEQSPLQAAQVALKPAQDQPAPPLVAARGEQP